MKLQSTLQIAESTEREGEDGEPWLRAMGDPSVRPDGADRNGPRMKNPAGNRRGCRRFQFSLRTLLIVLTLLAVQHRAADGFGERWPRGRT
jgi:hypothetical protein